MVVKDDKRGIKQKYPEEASAAPFNTSYNSMRKESYHSPNQLFSGGERLPIKVEQSLLPKVGLLGFADPNISRKLDG